MPNPFSQTLLLWRRHRGLTQQRLARAAGIPRPNLSAIERGRREVTLPTLRALALALEVRPGALVDGLPPASEQVPARFSRDALERIAEAVVQGHRLSRPGERLMADLLLQVTRRQSDPAVPRHSRQRWPIRAGEAAWLMLEALCSPTVLRSLLERIEDRRRAHAPQTN